MQIEICDTDYNKFVRFLGTAHFTRRSVEEASQTVKSTKTRDLAIELDERRFDLMNRLCMRCPRRVGCFSKCEFIVASEALGNIDANIWLLDMSETEMKKRINMLSNPWISKGQLYLLNRIGDEILPWLWERGYKDEVIRRSNKRIKALRKVTPHVLRVLIEERNALMAARLAAIATGMLDKEKKPTILALVGATHVEGIKALLRKPILIRESLRRFSLSYSQPTQIRRVQVGG